MTTTRAVLVALAVAVLLPGRHHPLDAQGASDILVGLAPGGRGYVEKLGAGAPHENLAWLQVNWPAYNTGSGATRPSHCQLDADVRFEVVIGLGPYAGAATGGFLEVKDDSNTGYAHLAWLRIDWPAYNAVNGETFPACGDIDGDGLDEIVIGFGVGGGGYLKLLDDATAGYVNVAATPGGAGWLQVGWPAYNADNGETHPALGNLDGDASAEIAVGYGPNGNGFVKLLDHSVSFFAPLSGTPGGAGWIQLNWPAFNQSNGGIWPAIGDLNNDGAGELVLGLDIGGGGYLQIRGNNAAAFAPVAGTPTAGGWVQVNWPAYNAAVGTTFPTIGDVDGDLRNELLVGLENYPAAGGYFEVKEDLTLGVVPKSWGRVHWPDYNGVRGMTRLSTPR